MAGASAHPPDGGGTVSDMLRQAASLGKLDRVQEMLQAGAVFDSDQDGRTALHYAALHGHADITRFLMEKGCPLNTKDASGYTPLHRAASGGHVEVITLLLEAGCDVNVQDEHGNAALHEAAWHGFSKTLELLVKHDVDIAVTNKAGFTALHLSAQNGHNESTRVMLYAGCNNDHKNNYGDTPLHAAARYGHAGVTRILISARAKLHEQNKNGDTALHIAAALKRRKIAKLLAESGIDISIKNKQNETAMDVARRKEHEEITLIIQSIMRNKASKVPRIKEVNFKEDLHTEIDGPVVVPDGALPTKPDTKPDKGKKFFFFKKKKTKEKPKPPADGGVKQQKSVPTDKTGNVGHNPVHGFFSQYVPRPGVQYYRDLAGNVKQGPVGYSPMCNCLPAIRRLEQRVESTNQNVCGHLESQHQMRNKIDRTSMEVRELKQYTHDRFIEEEKECYERIDHRVQENTLLNQDEHRPMPVKDWLETRLESYGHCLDHHHDDSALPNNNIFTNIHETENGRLFKSRSDETLSQSDNHSGHFRKREFYENRQAAMQQIRAWQMPNYSRDRNRVRVQSQPAQKPPQSQYQQPQQPHQPQQPQPQQPHQQQLHKQHQQQHQQQHHQQQQRQMPVEARVEIRKGPKQLDLQSPSTVSTHNSPYVQSPDSTYMSMNSYQTNGAIPKRLPQSHSWQNGKPYRSTSGSRGQGPVTHSTPKSRDSSPFENQYSSIPKSQTDSALSGNRNVSQKPSVPLRSTLPRPSVPPSSASSPQKPIPSAKPAHLSAKPSHLSQSTSSITKPGDRLQTNHPRPTFTTFGYDESSDGHTAPANSPEQVKLDSSAHINPNTDTQLSASQGAGSSTPRSNTGTINSGSSGRDEPDVHHRPRPNFSPQESYGFVPSSKDDTYTSRNTANTALRQRTRSNEGLLLDEDTPRRNLFGRSKSEERTLDAPDHSQSPVTIRAHSESRNISNMERGSAIYSTPQKTSINQTSSVYSTPVYRQTSNSVADSRSAFNASSPVNTSVGNSGVPRGDNSNPTVSRRNYTPVKEIPVGNVVQYKGPLNSVVNRNSDNYSPTGRDSNGYSTVRDVRLVRDSNQNLVSKGDVPEPVNQRAYYSHQDSSSNNYPGPKPSSLEPRSQTAYQTYLTGGSSRENLFQRESSPNICNNSKEDSSSNPDSGYSSKIYGKGGLVIPPSSSSTPSSSFSTDRGLSTPSNTNSPHSQYSNGDYEVIPTKQYQEEIQSEVQNWYKRKLHEASNRFRDDSPTKVSGSPQGQGQIYSGRIYNGDTSEHSHQGYSGNPQYNRDNQYDSHNTNNQQQQYSGYTNSYGNQGNYGSPGRQSNGYQVSNLVQGSDV